MDSLRSAWRQTKNIAFGYSEIQAKLRDATSIENHGPSTGQLQELAQATQHSSYLIDMVYIIEKRLNDHGKYWRHVYKSLVVIEFCSVFGSEAFVMYSKEIIHRIKTLKEFIHVDEIGRDKGILVREKSKALVELLSNDSILAEARRSGIIPNLSRPKSAEPLLVDPKQRKRLGVDNFADMQNMDEVEALKIALDESRRESGQAPLKYKSLELDTDSDSSGDDQPAQNPFANFNQSTLYMESNPFMNHQQPLLPEPIYANPFNFIEAPPVLQIEPIPMHFKQVEPSIEAFAQIEYNVNSMERHLNRQSQEFEKPFVPLPINFPNVADNNISAKPVGPHMAAPQYAYRSDSIKRSSHEKIENPFGEDHDVILTEAQNSPFISLQK